MRLARLGTLAAALLAVTAGCDTARTLESGESELGSCNRCHGFPPATTRSGETHPAVAAEAAACNPCHSDTVAADGTLIPGGAHQNGVADATVAHPMPFVADHTAAALAGLASCRACHGNDFAGGSARSCTACHESTPGIASWTTNCTFCHGTRTAGVTTATAAAAPPQAVVGTGDQTNANSRVGAHQAHLVAGTFSDPIACATCHAVPTGAQALTHFQGGGARGAISFGGFATKGVSGAAYTGGTCNVYCHGAGTEFANAAGTASPAWTEPNVACGSCHALPPVSGPSIGAQTAHAFHVAGQGLTCSTCHPVPATSRATHVNGTKNVVVQLSGGGTQTIAGWSCTTCHQALGVDVHPIPFVAEHTTAALADIGSCTQCHGAEYGGGIGQSCDACHQGFGYADWKTNCTFCHGTRTAGFAGTPASLPAPPQTVAGTGDQTSANPRVGAHQKHLGNGSTLSDGVACTECHAGASDLTHIGGSGAAQLEWGPLARTGGATPSMSGGTCSNTYCHGATTPGVQAAPTWAPPTAMTCGSCHEQSPTTGRHPAASGSPHGGFDCLDCHGTGFGNTSISGAAFPLHVDGALNKAPSLNWQDAPVKSCDPFCHGRQSW